MTKTTRSRSEFRRAQRSIPGGVNSPVRAFRSVGGTPRFIAKAKGARITDVDGNEYIDYVGSWGPMILGHADPKVIEAVQRVAADGLSFGAPTALETELARKVIELMPSIELVRFVSSGTEATMSAIRLARGFTGRDTIIKFEGCYHGHADSLLIKAGSGALTLGVPSSPGVPAELAAHTLTLDYNDATQVREAFARHGSRIACVIVEPVAGNMGVVPPEPGFLEALRKLCERAGPNPLPRQRRRHRRGQRAGVRTGRGTGGRPLLDDLVEPADPHRQDRAPRPAPPMAEQVDRGRYGRARRAEAPRCRLVGGLDGGRGVAGRAPPLPGRLPPAGGAARLIGCRARSGAPPDQTPRPGRRRIAGGNRPGLSPPAQRSRVSAACADAVPPAGSDAGGIDDDAQAGTVGARRRGQGVGKLGPRAGA